MFRNSVVVYKTTISLVEPFVIVIVSASLKITTGFKSSSEDNFSFGTVRVSSASFLVYMEHKSVTSRSTLRYLQFIKKSVLKRASSIRSKLLPLVRS